jgi:type II restriction enzyme
MVKFELLGFDNLDEYMDYFMKTLMQTNRTYDYYVNWEKVKNNVQNYVTEISILNSLTKIEPSQREKQLRNLIFKYPEIIQVIPLIIAVREKNLVVFDLIDNLYKKFDFSGQNIELENIINFCKHSGIIELFGEINDLYAYLLGMEVGLDSNARKNRSGKIFENIIELLLNKKLSDYKNLHFEAEDSKIKIKRNKRADFVIYKNNIPKIVIECNFYGSTGSKPIETANAYIDLEKKLKEEDLTFIWITDGPGWPKMHIPLYNSAKEIDFVLNYHILETKLDDIISSIQ